MTKTGFTSLTHLNASRASMGKPPLSQAGYNRMIADSAPNPLEDALFWAAAFAVVTTPVGALLGFFMGKTALGAITGAVVGGALGAYESSTPGYLVAPGTGSRVANTIKNV